MRKASIIAVSLFLSSFQVYAQMVEPVTKDLNLSIYNNNLALVKDVRNTPFKKGVNDVLFVGVATSIKPSSVMIMGDNIRVIEQNYDYALITPYNMLEKSVGKNVKTVRENPKTGESVFSSAQLLSYQNGEPVLRFDYGIEPNFNGRIILEELPQGLNQKPTLAAKISSDKAETKDLTLAYLTNGISWKTDYVADIKNEKVLDLTAWVTISNNSGITYENASIQLIAGQVNETRSYAANAPRLMMAKASMDMAAGVMENSADIEPESVSSYQLYTIPVRTTIKDNQTKQLSLFEKNDVSYQKEGRVRSPLYFGSDYAGHFEKLHPESYYMIENKEKSNLGIALPKGVMRFYENDSKNRLQFIGENAIKETPNGEKLELKLGNMFDVFVQGQTKKIRKISENVIKDQNGNCPRYQLKRAYDVEVVFQNGGDKEAQIVLTQNLPPETIIASESAKGKAKNGEEYEWRITLSKNDKKTLTYTAEVQSEERRCH